MIQLIMSKISSAYKDAKEFEQGQSKSKIVLTDEEKTMIDTLSKSKTVTNVLSKSKKGNSDWIWGVLGLFYIVPLIAPLFVLIAPFLIGFGICFVLSCVFSFFAGDNKSSWWFIVWW